MNHAQMELFRKYLRGTATPEEEKCIRRWLIEHEDGEEVKQILKEEWIQTSAELAPDIDMEDCWAEFKQKVKDTTQKDSDAEQHLKMNK